MLGSYSSSPDVHSRQLDTADGDAHEHGNDAVDSRPNRSGGDTKALLAAAREFLSRRCAASLASADSGTRHEERLAEAPVGGAGRLPKILGVARGVHQWPLALGHDVHKHWQLFCVQLQSFV